jgi:hypothetical protein
MAVKVPRYKPMSNVDLLNSFRNEASPEFRRRVPVSTQANIRSNLEKMYQYTAGRNEFIPALINKIGMSILRPKIYNNPLAEFKMGMLNSGDTVEEIIVGLAKAHTYDPTREYGEDTLFGIEDLDVQTSYHKITRQEFYKVTINDLMLKRAFLNDESGLWDFVALQFAAATISDNADEFTQTLAILPEYYRLNGFFKVNVPDISDPNSGEDEAKEFTRTVRALADTLPMYPWTHYNAAKMPIVTDVNELMLITTPEAKAAMDVEALAGMFNVAMGQINQRIVLIPAEAVADIPGFQGVLTTKNFWVIMDTLLETREQQNAAGLYSNHFFHHHEIISASRFETAILLTTEPGDTITRTVTPVTGIDPLEVYDVDTQALVTTFARGKRYLAVSDATTEGYNTGVQFELLSATPNVPLSPLTRIFQTGGIEISADEEATSITVRSIALDSPTEIKQETTFTVAGTRISFLPVDIFPDADNDNIVEATPKAPTQVGNKVTIPTVTGVQYKQGAANVNNGAEITISAATTFTAVARTGYEITTGATASWTFTL